MATETSNNVAPVLAKVSTYGGSAGAVFFGLTANELAAVSGVAIAAAGLLVSVFFHIRNDRRSQQRHDAEMKRLKRETDHHV